MTDMNKIPHKNWPPRLVAEVALAAACAALAVLTAFVPDWIELTLGLSPDDGGGEFEWGLVLAFAVAAVAAAGWARRDWRRWVRATMAG
jgi:hypothetical protein